MYFHQRKAFTMLEMTFVIVIIGILSAVAIPKLAMTSDDAVITKAKNTVSTIRGAIATERQKSILKGVFANLNELSSATGNGKAIFDGFNGDTANPVLTYPLVSCKDGTAKGCWINAGGTGTAADPTVYTYRMPLTGTVVFNLEDNRFVCATPADSNCKLLTR